MLPLDAAACRPVGCADSATLALEIIELLLYRRHGQGPAKLTTFFGLGEPDIHPAEIVTEAQQRLARQLGHSVRQAISEFQPGSVSAATEARERRECFTPVLLAERHCRGITLSKKRLGVDMGKAQVPTARCQPPASVGAPIATVSASASR